MGSSYSTQRKEHGKHNYSAYTYLLKAANDEFLDWGVTTAYYSANHYAKGKIFPHTEKIKGKDETFSEFDEYYNKLHKLKNRSLHKVLIDLSYKELPKEIAGAIKKLHDLSDTARYHDYKLSRHGNKNDIKRDVQSKLDKVKSHCES